MTSLTSEQIEEVLANTKHELLTALHSVFHRETDDADNTRRFISSLIEKELNLARSWEGMTADDLYGSIAIQLRKLACAIEVITSSEEVLLRAEVSDSGGTNDAK